MDKKAMVNEQPYWEERFASKDWQKYDGGKQTTYFMQLMLDHLPQWMKQDWSRAGCTICDAGCAEGEGADLLAEAFPQGSVEGFDFAQSAVTLAQEKHPRVHFYVDDIYTTARKHDVVVCSNVLEHLQRPEAVLENLANSAEQYLAVLTPLEDDFGFEEHVNRFTPDSFGMEYGALKLCYAEWIYCGSPYWPGYQVLLVYGKNTEEMAHTWGDSCGAAWEKAAFDRFRTELEEKTADWQKVNATAVELGEYGRSLNAEKQALQIQLEREHALRCSQERRADQAEEKLHQLEEIAAEEHNRLEKKLEKFKAAYEADFKRRAKETETLLNAFEQDQKQGDQLVQQGIDFCQQMMRAPLFQLMHLWGRIKSQIFRGGKVEKIHFLRWMLRREDERMDHRFQPLNSVFVTITQLQTLHQDENKALREYKEAMQIEGEQGICLASALETPYNQYDVIMLSVIDYDFRFQRPQHFATRFAKNGHRVFYINANFSRPASVTRRDENLYVVDLHSDQAAAIYGTDWSDDPLTLHTALKKLMWEYGIRDAITVVDYPNWVEAAQYLRRSYGFKFVVDYMDDYTGFLTPSEKNVKENCIRLLETSDLAVPSSQFLADIAGKYQSGQVEIVRNGTEYEHFHQAFGKTMQKDRPIVGYYGAVAHWFDAEKVVYLAENLPECDIVIVGAVTEWAEQLSAKKNIRLLGEKSYADLPEYLKTFDVCLIPFDTSTDLIKATNPVKFYEYLSAGKKVVATNIPELEPFRDRYVYMANDNETFLGYVKQCLQHTDTLASPEECAAFAMENDWQHRYEAFERQVRAVVPKISVIVLTYNNLTLNKLCTRQILSSTAYPNYELILVDNASTDGTREWLQEYEKHKPDNVKIILNEENLGFAGGNNVAMRQADGEYVVLLNNDTVPTRGWLTAMAKHMENDKKLGMCGPVTNSIGNEAKIAVNYHDLEELEQFAYRYTWKHRGEAFYHVKALALFCTMIRRGVMDQCGLLDDGYKVGMFEDDDYSEAVRAAGWKMAIVDDSFVHHQDGATFKKLDKNKYQNVFMVNKKRFEEKWNITWQMHSYRAGMTCEQNSDCLLNAEQALKTAERRDYSL